MFIKLSQFINEIYDSGLVHDDFEYNEIKSINDLIEQTPLKIKAKTILGYGSNGLAAKTTDNKVIKFCISIEEVNLLKKCKQYQMNHIVKIYDIFDIKYKTNNNRIAKGWLIYKDYIPSLPKSIEKDVDELEQITTYFKNRNKLLKFRNKQLVDNILSIEAELKQINIKDISLIDFNSSNLGFKNNKLILFDFVYYK